MAGTFDASALGNTLGTQLQNIANTPPPVFNQSLYAGLSQGTIDSLRALNNGAGLYQEGLNNAFNATANTAANGVDALNNFNAQAGSFTTVPQYDALYKQANVPTSTATNLQGQLAGLKLPSYADTQARNLYQQTQQPSYAQQGYQNLYSQLQDPSFAERGFQNQYNSLQGPTTSEQNLGNFANGSMVGKDPYFEEQLRRASAATQGLVNNQFSASGRLGSNLGTQVLADSLAGQQNTAREANYQNELDRQFQANAVIEAAKGQNAGLQNQALQGSDTARNNRFGLQTQALQGQDAATNNQLSRGLSALSSEDQFRLNQLGALTNTTGAIDTSNNNLTNTLTNVLSNKNAAETSASNAGLQASGLNLQAATSNAGLQLNAANSLGGQFQNALMPTLTSLGVGQIIDADHQAALLGQNDLFNRQNNAQLNQTGTIMGLLNNSTQAGTPGLQQQVPWWQQALGFAGSALGNILGGS